MDDALPGRVLRARTSAWRIVLSGKPIGMSTPTTRMPVDSRTMATSSAIVGATRMRGRGAPGSSSAPTQPAEQPSTPSTGATTSTGAGRPDVAAAAECCSTTSASRRSAATLSSRAAPISPLLRTGPARAVVRPSARPRIRCASVSMAPTQPHRRPCVRTGGWTPRNGPVAPEVAALMETRATIGVTGLATMGRNLARNIARHGRTVAVHNRTTARMTSLLEQFGDEGDFVGAETVEDFVAAIQKPRAIIVMVKAGDPTDAVIDELVPLLDEGDIVVDAGNAHFADTLRREKALSDKGIHFVGMGVSGGEEGALNGPSIMVGGSDHAY